MEKPSIRELAGDHPVALANAIEALARRWPDMAEVDVECVATPGFLRATSAEVPEAPGGRLRALQGRISSDARCSGATVIDTEGFLR